MRPFLHPSGACSSCLFNAGSSNNGLKLVNNKTKQMPGKQNENKNKRWKNKITILK
jgi:hypothetical protein